MDYANVEQVKTEFAGSFLWRREAAHTVFRMVVGAFTPKCVGSDLVRRSSFHFSYLQTPEGVSAFRPRQWSYFAVASLKVFGFQCRSSSAPFSMISLIEI